MRHRLISWISRLTRGFFYALRLWRRQWPWLLAAVALSVALTAMAWRALPEQWQSEGSLIITPLIVREGYLLTVDSLGDHYVARMRSDESLKRLAVQFEGRLSPPQIAEALTIRNEGNGLLRVQSRLSEPNLAEALTATLLRDFEATLNAENRQRVDLDRVVVQRTAVTLPHRVRPSLATWLWRGALLGVLVAALALLARDYQQRQRIASALEAEQLVHAPTLGTIPVKR